MRKLLFLSLLFPFALCAQTVQYGYFSMNEVLDSLPEYRQAQDEYNALVERCDSEVAHSEEELTRCYVAFLEGQNKFPEPILRKRQKELQDLVDRSVVLRDQLKEWLVQAHDSLFVPIMQEVDEAVERVCEVKELAYAIDLDKGVYRYVNPKYSRRITELVIEEMRAPGSVTPDAKSEEVAPDAESEEVTPVEPVPMQAVKEQEPVQNAEIVIE